MYLDAWRSKRRNFREIYQDGCKCTTHHYIVGTVKTSLILWETITCIRLNHLQINNFIFLHSNRPSFDSQVHEDPHFVSERRTVASFVDITVLIFSSTSDGMNRS